MDECANRGSPRSMDAVGTRVSLRAEPFIAGIEQAHGKCRKIIPISGSISLQSDIHPSPCIEHQVLVLNATLDGQNTGEVKLTDQLAAKSFAFQCVLAILDLCIQQFDASSEVHVRT